MRVVAVPNCNQQLIFKGVNENKRVDDRTRKDCRRLEMAFSIEMGSCLVSLGNTKVLATVSSEIAEPKATRPSEGMLQLSVDLSPMASPHYEAGGKLSDEGVEIVRLLERTIRDSRCLDMESLCLISGEKAWQIRVDLVVLNTEGNMVEACSVACLAALAHFRRPDVTITDGKLKIHSFDEKHSIPLTLLHFPFCTKFCFFDKGKHYVVDPLEIEELVCEGYLVVGANSYRELTALHISGKSMINKDHIMSCCTVAVERSKYLTDYVKSRLDEDTKSRAKGNSSELGFAALLRSRASLIIGPRKQVNWMDEQEEEIEEKEEEVFNEYAPRTKVYRFGPEGKGSRRPSGQVGEGGPSTWDFNDGHEDDDENAVLDEKDMVHEVRQKADDDLDLDLDLDDGKLNSKKGKKQKAVASKRDEEDNDSSSEGDIVVVDSHEFK